MKFAELPDEFRFVLKNRDHPLRLEQPGDAQFEVSMRPPKSNLNDPVVVRFSVKYTDERGPVEDFVEEHARWYDLEVLDLAVLGAMLTCGWQIRDQYLDITVYEDSKNPPRRKYYRVTERAFSHVFGLGWRRRRERRNGERIDVEFLVFTYVLWADTVKGAKLRDDRWFFEDVALCSLGEMIVDPDECAKFGRELARAASQLSDALFEEANRTNFWND